MTDILNDPRLDPRVKVFLARIPKLSEENFTSRQQMIEAAQRPERVAADEYMRNALEVMDNEQIAPSAGLSISTHEFVSDPDKNVIKVQFIRPQGNKVLPCVYYIHGGGMRISSCFDGNFRAWGKMIAANGVAIAMVDFRNSEMPSSTPEVAPFPAGLNDCVSGLKWLSETAESLGIDPSKITIAGESGGGNLALATAMRLKQDGTLHLIKGIYAMCPYIAGEWPQPHLPSSVENNGLLLSLHSNQGAMIYGIEQFEAENPLAWPSFASEDDVKGFPSTMISLNECDPLRDEGLAFYRLLLKAGVPAQCRQVMGTCHAIELFPIICPEISADTAANLARFAKLAGQG